MPKHYNYTLFFFIMAHCCQFPVHSLFLFPQQNFDQNSTVKELASCLFSLFLSFYSYVYMFIQFFISKLFSSSVVERKFHKVKKRAWKRVIIFKQHNNLCECLYFQSHSSFSCLAHPYSFAVITSNLNESERKRIPSVTEKSPKKDEYSQSIVVSSCCCSSFSCFKL